MCTTDTQCTQTLSALEYQRGRAMALQDVGLSKILINESTLMTSFQGTFEWAPPELINGGECSEKADIYSFGVILWEIVTAERPFRKQFRPPQCAPAPVCLGVSQSADHECPAFASTARHGWVWDRWYWRVLGQLCAASMRAPA